MKIKEKNGTREIAQQESGNRTDDISVIEREHALIQSVIDNAASVIFVKDREGRLVIANRRFREIHGLGDRDVSGMTVFDLFPEKLAQSMAESDRLLLTMGSVMESEKKILHADGTEHAYINVKFPIKNFTGYIGGISTDITERRRIEETLINNEKLLSDAMRLSGLGIYQWNIKENDYQWANETYDLFGVSRRTFNPSFENVCELILPEDITTLKNAMEEAIAQKRENFELTFRLKSDDKRLLHKTGTITYDEKGDAARITGVFRDVTKTRRMEEELLRAQKLESIGELAGGIAHDINNLLQGIIGGISVAKMKTDDEDLQRLFDQIKSSALKTRSVTNRLLTFQTDGVPIRDREPIADIIKDSASMVLHGSDIECRINIEKDLFAINMDSGQISQAINNVIMNARHAMNDHGTIEINAANIAVDKNMKLPLAPGEYALVTIKDSGAGIPEQILPRIFDPFFTTKERASGLGLAITFSIIKKHDGHICAQSSVGSGTVFNIYLPSAGQMEAAPEKYAPQTEKRPLPSAAASSKKRLVLVMDDEDVVRDVSGEMLQLLGYDVEFASDGDEAIELYKKTLRSGKPFDAVIMDLSIPGGMGGKDAIKKLLELDPNVKAIVSSGYSRDPIMEEYVRYGFCGVISKPYRVADFKKVVKSVVEG